MNTKTFTPSPQQSAYFQWITSEIGSAVLEAVAGAGKTTTLVHGLSLMSGYKFFGAYNKKICEEIEKKTAGIENLTVSTFHAAGFKAWRKAAPNVRVDADKCKHIFREACDRNPEAGYSLVEGPVLHLVSLAKQSAIGIASKSMVSIDHWLQLIDHFDIEVFNEETGVDNTKLIIQLARKTLEASIAANTRVVDFDDMIYAPLYHNVKMFQFDWVLIDEAQDTNETRRLLALRMLKRGGRLVAVGDPRQAIYGFAGADSNSLRLIAESVNAKSIPLTITYRCPKKVVEYAHNWVSHIMAADTAPDGIVEHAEIANLGSLAKPGDAILCRFNAPLIKHVYQFIANGIPAKVEGREIGSGLKTLASRWKVRKLSTLIEKLDAYRERESNKYRVKEQESKAAAVEDKVDCLKVIVDRVIKIDPECKKPVERICAEIDAIFTEDGSAKVVLLSSIHKSKGREWENVFWLQTGPSAWARKEWEQEQEANLCYVAATRAMNRLVLIDISKESKD